MVTATKEIELSSEEAFAEFMPEASEITEEDFDRMVAALRSMR